MCARICAKAGARLCLCRDILYVTGQRFTFVLRQVGL